MLVCIIQLFDPSTDLSRPFSDTLSTLKNEPLKIGEATAFVFVAYAGVTKVAAIGGSKKTQEGTCLLASCFPCLSLLHFTYLSPS